MITAMRHLVTYMQAGRQRINVGALTLRLAHEECVLLRVSLTRLAVAAARCRDDVTLLCQGKGMTLSDDVFVQ